MTKRPDEHHERCNSLIDHALRCSCERERAFDNDPKVYTPPRQGDLSLLAKGTRVVHLTYGSGEVLSWRYVGAMWLVGVRYDLPLGGIPGSCCGCSLDALQAEVPSPYTNEPLVHMDVDLQVRLALRPHCPDCNEQGMEATGPEGEHLLCPSCGYDDSECSS